MSLGPKATSVTVAGEPDTFEIVAGYHGEMTPEGQTRLVAAIPTADLARIHGVLVSALKPPLNLLYRQKVNRQDPKPQGSPPRDFVALDLPVERVLAGLQAGADVAYHDARCEIWVRGSFGEQVILDTDGMLFCYPDDPSFRDALEGAGVADIEVEGIDKRDYVKQWFHAEADAAEQALIAALGMQEVPHRKG